jgi:hypothetical protein
MSVSEAFRGIVDESVESTELASSTNRFNLEPRCRICRNDQVRTKVNDLLATGDSYAMVLRALGDDNVKLEQRDRVTIDSIRNHTARHFPVQQVARATYREILERRANENSVDFIEGVATAITPLAFLETVMVKGYPTLVDEHTSVSYRDGMEAALKLAEALRKDAGEYDKVHMTAEMGRIIEVVRTFIPAERWPDVQASLRGETSISEQTSQAVAGCAWCPSTTLRTRTATDGYWMGEISEGDYRWIVPSNNASVRSTRGHRNPALAQNLGLARIYPSSHHPRTRPHHHHRARQTPDSSARPR